MFVNCPFDRTYWSLFEAMVFAVVACGLRPRCALEELDSGTVRLDRISRLVESCGLAIHDLSRVETSGRRSLPRFDMPFELGLDIGCRRFGSGPVRGKRMLILDARRHRYQAFLSDIAGQDIQTHNGSARTLIKRVRDWLRVCTNDGALPGEVTIARWLRGFARQLPESCRHAGLDRRNLLFVDYVRLAEAWVAAERQAR